MTELGVELARSVVDVTSYQYGTVTAVGPLFVMLDSEATGVETVSVAPYGLAVGDRVLVLVQGADRIVIAKSPAVTAWTNVTFAGTWVNFGSPYLGVQYRKVGDMVQVRGLAKDGANNSVMFPLPAGHRPPLDLQFPSSPSASQLTIEVQAGGDVFVFSTSTSVVSTNFQFSTSS